tara:strand:- start:4574 stop:5026 length:453 start_codon:yes stop_codon:yes gene_type:complete
MYDKYWGPATWTLFHVLVEKLTNDSLVQHIIHLIKQICSCLPCPTCREHSTNILNNYSLYHTIHTKEDLKRFVWEFHNQVNKKLGVQPYNYNGLTKYSQYQLGSILTIWLKYFNIFITDVKLYTIKHKINNTKAYTEKFIHTHKDKFNLN